MAALPNESASFGVHPHPIHVRGGAYLRDTVVYAILVVARLTKEIFTPRACARGKVIGCVVVVVVVVSTKIAISRDIGV